MIIEEKITSIHTWVQKQHNKVKAKAETEQNSSAKIMLHAKATAYLDVVCFIQQKHGKFVTTDFPKKKVVASES